MIPQSFLDALSKLLSLNDKRAKRLEQALTTDPEKSAEHVANELGSSTQPIKFCAEEKLDAAKEDIDAAIKLGNTPVTSTRNLDWDHE